MSHKQSYHRRGLFEQRLKSCDRRKDERRRRRVVSDCGRIPRWTGGGLRRRMKKRTARGGKKTNPNENSDSLKPRKCIAKLSPKVSRAADSRWPAGFISTRTICRRNKRRGRKHGRRSEAEQARQARRAAPRAAMLPRCATGGRTYRGEAPNGALQWLGKMEVKKPRAWALRTPFLAPESAQTRSRRRVLRARSTAVQAGASQCVREREGEREGESLAR